jgi:DNA-binding NarL/FixJ family response regulator
VGAAADAAEAVALARRLSPDVALLDVRMPMGGGPKAAAGIRLSSPETVVIALSAHDDATSILSMLERGVGTYVAKDSPADQVIEAIRRGAEQKAGAFPPPA